MTENMTRNTALIIIDMQVGIIKPLPVYHGTRVLEQISKLLSGARASGTPVIYVQHDGPAGHRVEPGTGGWPIHPRVEPSAGEVVVHKRACDSFFETSLQRELEERRIDHLVVAGCMTEYCIDTTCRRAVSLGYDVTLAGDAHATDDTEHLTASQIIAHHNELLDGLDAGDHQVLVKPTGEISFPARAIERGVI